MPGPQSDLFTSRGIDTFYKERYQVSAQTDRMGCRLDGPQIESSRGSDIISDGIALGSIQIPAQGTPIVMLADRQTTGGYAEIATVASVDIPLLGATRDQAIRAVQARFGYRGAAPARG